MSFQEPGRLWLLLVVPALVGAYVLVVRHRRRAAVRFAALPMLESVLPRTRPWRRTLAALVALVPLVLLVLAFARPEGDVQVPRARAVVVVVIDVSLSMQADDVDPDRITAARDAARTFAAGLPATFQVGLVMFAGTATVSLAPTTDRQQFDAVLDTMRLAESTAIGEAVYTALTSADAAAGVPGALPGATPGATPGPTPAPPPATAGPSAVPRPSAQAQEVPPRRIVLLSDGGTNAGRPTNDAAAQARAEGVSVSTIAFGTPQGTVELRGQTIPVPPNEAELRSLATTTEGAAYTARDAGQLRTAYADIGRSVGTRTEQQEITDRLVGIALVAALASAAISLAWNSRLS